MIPTFHFLFLIASMADFRASLQEPIPFAVICYCLLPVRDASPANQRRFVQSSQGKQIPYAILSPFRTVIITK